MKNHGPADEELSRVGIAIPENLLGQFDDLCVVKGYSNRSEAVRDLMRDALVERDTSLPDQQVVGTVTLVYDHHIRSLNDKLVGMQHEHHDQIVSTVHIHLDHHNCLEVVILRGLSKDVRRIADGLIATKGVRHGKLTVTVA